MNLFSLFKLQKYLLICLCVFINGYYAKGFNSLTNHDIGAIIYYHNTYRYVISIGNTQQQPAAADMKLLRWNQTLAVSIDRISNECIQNPLRGYCPPTSVYPFKTSLNIPKIILSWFNGNQYYDYSSDSCRGGTCQAYKQILNSKSVEVGCSLREIYRKNYFICQYSQRPEGRPYKNGVPCSACSDDSDLCFKEIFCSKTKDCRSVGCEKLLRKSEEEEIQGDQHLYCGWPEVDCTHKFYKIMCPKTCLTTSTFSSTTTRRLTTAGEVFVDNDVCKLTTIDCSKRFFQILCRKSCAEGVLCRDPNINCRNVFYAKCQKCQKFNGKMSDSKITSTARTPQLVKAISAIVDPKCQDLPYDGYCTDRGEMCFHVVYRMWMNKFCCYTCQMLGMCYDYLDLQGAGKCAEIFSSGMCDSLWSQTYCRKTCKKC